MMESVVRMVEHKLIGIPVCAQVDCLGNTVSHIN